MKLHLPVFLRKVLLSCFACLSSHAIYSGSVAVAADLILDGDTSLSIDYSEADSIQNLEGGALCLKGGSVLQLLNCGEGNGKMYTLFTGVGGLQTADGSLLTLDSFNNMASLYFDVNQLGSGFWSHSILQLSHDGTLYLVRYDEDLQDAVVVTTRPSEGADYQYYTGVTVESVYYSSSTLGTSSSMFRLCNNGLVIFRQNTTKGAYSAQGGAIGGGDITLNDNGSVSFIENTVALLSTTSYNSTSGCGGAIYGNVTMANNNSINFNKNSAHDAGGAIGGSATISDNGMVAFTGNTAGNFGAAMYGDTLTFKYNGSVTFSENVLSGLYSKGGAIYAQNAVKFDNNGALSFNNNSAGQIGGAIWGTEVLLRDNDVVIFSENKVRGYGGAIYGTVVSMNNNNELSFVDNEAKGEYGSRGGAIYSPYSNESITICGNGSVSFANNITGASGGAIWADCAMTLCDNGSISFSANTAGGAGAIYTGELLNLSNNGYVEFVGNTASFSLGGAIKSYGPLQIQNNESVLFEKNTEISDGSYRLRGIYIECGKNEVSLSAAYGKGIEFRESVYIDSDSAVKLNAAYSINDRGHTIVQQGDIIFTGKYAEMHLDEILASSNVGRTATQEEILNSCTSEVYAMTNLYGGRLMVEDGAIYKGYGITAMKKSASTVLVKNATLSHSGYDLNFNQGTTLEIAGVSSISGHVNMMSNSTLSIHVDANHTTMAALTLSGSLLLEDDITLNLSSETPINKGCSYVLISGVSMPDNWTSANVLVTTGTDGWSVSFDDLSWVDNTLWLYYDDRPNLETATWSNASSNGKWDMESSNWLQGAIEYEYFDGVDVVFGDAGAGVVSLVGAIAPKSVLVDSDEDYIWNADETKGGSLTGGMQLTKRGEGKLTITTVNDYTGGTTIEGGSIVVGSATALGTGVVSLNGGILEIADGNFANELMTEGNSTIIVQQDTTWHMSSVFSNSGTLNISGSIDVASVGELTDHGETYTKGGGNGFKTSSAYSIQLVDNSGTINSTATIKHGDIELVLGQNGMATAEGTTDFTTYYITAGHEATVNTIRGESGGALSLVDMTGGTLKVNGDATVKVSGGNVNQTSGVLSGSISDAMLSISGGTVTATLEGINTLSGDNKLFNVLDNDGTLNISGTLDVSGVGALTDHGETYTKGGNNGFKTSSAYSIQLVDNSGTINSTATIKHGDIELVLGQNGMATAEGTTDFTTYYITAGHEATVNTIRGESGGALSLIDMTGGTLKVNGDATVKVTGGEVIITDESTLSGEMDGTTVRSAEGNFVGDIDAVMRGSCSLEIGGGAITVNGNNSYTGDTLVNGGTLVAGNAAAFGLSDIKLQSGKLDLNGYDVENDILATGGILAGGTQYGGGLSVTGDVKIEGDFTAEGGIDVNRGSLSGGNIVDTFIIVDGEGEDMTISSAISGDSSVTLQGGNLTITNGNNNYTGGTIVNGGHLTLGQGGSLGAGGVILNGGTFDTNGNEINNDITINGGTVISSYILGQERVLTVGKGGMEMVGNLTLDGGRMVFNGLPLTVNGKVDAASAVEVFVSGYGVIDMDGTVILARLGEDASGVTADHFVNIGYGTLNYDAEQNQLSLTLTPQNVWGGGNKVSWVQGLNTAWQNFETFVAGNRVVFNTAGTVKIEGGVEPASILVDVEKALTFSTTYTKKTDSYSGVIRGKGCLVKRGKGTLTMNDGNTYSGGTFIEAGTVKAKGAASFGTGVISLMGGTLDLASKAVGNDITLTDSAAIKGGAKYTGEFTLNGGELQKGSVLNVADSATLEGGVMNGTLSGMGSVKVTGAVQLGDAAKLTTNGLDIKGTLNVGSKGLTMNSKSSAISIAGGTLASEGKLSAYSLTMEGGTLEITNAKPMALKLNGVADFTAGAKVNLYGAFTAADLDMNGVTFTLAMDDDDVTAKSQPKAQKITLKDKKATSELRNGSTLDIMGSMSVAGGLSLSNSTLALHDWADAAKPKAMGLTVKGDLSLLDASVLSLTGKLSAGSMNLTNSDIKLENTQTAQSITLTMAKDADKQPVTNTFTGSTLDINGSMTVAGSLALNNTSIALVDDAAKPKAMGLKVKGALAIADAAKDDATELYFTGKLTAGSLNLTDADIKLENTTTAQSIALTMAKDSQKNPITNTLANSTIYANGSMTVAGNLSLTGNSTITLEDKVKGKAMNLAVKGDLFLSDSSITLSGALSAANMTLESGSINLTSTKLQTIKVSKTLTFNGNIKLGLQDGLDIKMNKSYNLITFKTLEGVTDDALLYELLGLEDKYCTLTLDLKKKAITLKVTEEEWNQWVTDHTTKTELEPEEAPIEAVAATAAVVEPGITTAAAVEEELPEEEEAEATVVTTTLPVQQAADVEALIAKVSDTLVQTTWGTAKASRAFVDSIGNRGQNATALAEGLGAAWGGVIGATSRLSSHGGSLGADHTLSGAVFGAEMNATDGHSIGLAMGVTWGEINTLSAYNVDQDSTHLAAYGQSRLMQNGKKGLTLDWSAAYGRSENDADILGSSYDWAQHALQLDARLSYAYALNERTTLRGFGGMQYLHIDSDTPEKGMKADSLQNVRVEVGVGATYMATAKTALYGEVSFIGDVVRDNPATHIGGVCRGGSNPGRAGMNLSVGATHTLNENWSLNTSYNMELQPRANAHNATIGATYRF